MNRKFFWILLASVIACFGVGIAYFLLTPPVAEKLHSPLLSIVLIPLFFILAVTAIVLSVKFIFFEW